MVGATRYFNRSLISNCKLVGRHSVITIHVDVDATLII